MCGDGTNDVGALKMSHCGISIISVPDVEAKQRDAIDGLMKVQEEKKSKKKRKPRNEKKTWEEHLQALAEAEEELNNVALGDASVASPFTSRQTSIKCTKDVLQRGRCTLVTMTQIYKILGVNCLVNALVLSSLHLVGAKQGDRQLTVVGVVVAGLFFFVTKGEPLNKLSPRRPPSSVLCTQVLVSIALQFLIHFICIMAITALSKFYLDPYDPSLVPDGAFNPNTLNSATFIMTVLTTINTFVVNYRGRPFMQDLHENKMMMKGLQVCYAVLFGCALEIFPPINDLMQLSPLPTNGEAMTAVMSTENVGVHVVLISVVEALGFKMTLCALMVLDTVVSYTSEKALIKFFG
jgi:cation-transporting ATPase 13A1